ncbi:MAG: glycosyltransferase, partial [Patescibacteria group bacterium]
MPARKLKVALMSYAMDNRQGKGTALYARKLTERLLSDDRLQVTLVHYEHVDDPLYEKAEEIIMPRLRLPIATRFVRQLLFFWKYRNRQFDIIHWFQPRVYPFFWLAPARRLIVTAYCAGDITAPGVYPLSRRMFNYSLRRFNHKLSAILSSSEFGREEIIQYYGSDPARTHTIYLGGGEEYISLPKSDAQKLVRAKYAISPPFILDISRHVAHKNIVSVVKAFEIFRSAAGLPHELVIVGFRGNDSERIA